MRRRRRRRTSDAKTARAGGNKQRASHYREMLNKECMGAHLVRSITIAKLGKVSVDRL